MDHTPSTARNPAERTFAKNIHGNSSMKPQIVKTSPFDVSRMSGVVVSFIDKPSIDGNRFVSELKWLQSEATRRCLVDAEMWASELLACCPEQFLPHLSAIDEQTECSSRSFVDKRKEQQSRFARSLIRDRDYIRASFFLAKTKDADPIDRFLYYRCKFLTSWQGVLEDEAECVERRVTFGTVKTGFADLYAELSKENVEEDVFLLYLKGLTEIELGLKDEALETMKEVIARQPRIWPAWEVITKLISSIEEADKLQVEHSQSTWMADWFMVLTLERFHQYARAVQWAEKLVERGLTSIPLITVKIAACSNYRHDHDQAIENFEQVRALDPYRIKDLQLYSDSLYIRRDETKLSQLALALYDSHKFRWETCCIVANYYAIRRDSEQAIKFFHRALKLNPQAAWLWVLIGHEYMELKNTPVACVSYRKAIELDANEYRAWYGLGQMYDICKMPGYALFYYQQAQKCRPHDSRMLIALGDVYAKLDKTQEAEKCFSGAYLFGDIEGQALWMLAKLYESRKMDLKAAKTFEVFIIVYESVTNIEDNLMYAILYLARYYLKHDDFEKAAKFATRCLEYDQICQEGNRLIRDIALKRERVAEPAQEEEPAVAPEEENNLDQMVISDDDDEDVSF